MVTVLVIVLTVPAVAMNLRHYDTTSLVYLSTDIVIATLVEDEAHNFSATVSESLYGATRPGDRINGLAPFLAFFWPLKSGMTVVLFLDRRPHEYDFIHNEVASSTFAIPPSGIYLIDEYDHVHQYFQRRNPGSYEAQGYEYSWQRRVAATPTKNEDLALPSLEEVRRRIASAIGYVDPIRARLDRTASHDDEPFLMELLAKIPRGHRSWSEVEGNAIFDRAIEQVRSMHDAELLKRGEDLRMSALR
jgi:hypothetical protein